MRLRSLASIFLAATAAPHARSAEIKIGVVNIREVFARYKKADDLKRAQSEKLAPRQKELERRQRELVRRAGELRRFDKEKEGPQEQAQERRLREVKEFELQEYLLKLDYRQFRREVQAANERLMCRLWEELAEACRRVARAEGHDLILRFYGPDRSAKTDRERLEVFQGDSLLYTAPSIDITARVLEVLENAYRRGIKLVPDEGDLRRRQPEAGGHG